MCALIEESLIDAIQYEGELELQATKGQHEEF
jgi:hypothetical protein